MQGRMSTLDELLNMTIPCQYHIIMKGTESAEEATEDMSGWIDGNFLKAYPVSSDGCADTSIKNIVFESSYNPLCNLKKMFLAC
ncbi:hypothetical protein KSZ_07440 [Dictyobacter formicarum]|uniref:Uncharacterized protein n=1 Tax=Dictyobacter formicarum TaxID=2778368 RepID=A0ABQ3VAB3_9CHLR|nr:hypothetical protein KSZ_07440 [Dictyobacter formicarum]